MSETLSIRTANPDDENVTSILNELCLNLQERFGSNGKNSFIDWKNNNSNYVFIIAKLDNEIVGCGAIRPLSETTAEVKRMYAKYPRKKIGQTILSFLEAKAKEIGYSKLVLETRIKNLEATQFYLKSDYTTIPNYGKYANNTEAICFEKKLI
jgi:N-acetylglutamate synthase-like GNAT family acetyltransferase